MDTRIKKGIAILLTAVMVLAMAIQSFAAPLSYARPAATGTEPAKITGTWSKDAAGNWYFNSQSGAAKGGWYYLNITNKSTEYNWFCFDTNGVMRTGWVQDKKDPSVWYYTGEIKDSSEGGLVKGWATDPHDGKKYYLDPSTGIMCYGWKQINGVWYYFGEKQYANASHPYGAMYVNEKTPDGYYVGSSGAWRRYTSSGGSSRSSSYIPPTPPIPPTPAVKTTKITFDNNGGSGETDSVTATFGEAMPTVSTPSKADYDFLGYYDESEAGNMYYYPDGSSAREWDKEVDEFTLYAQWEVACLAAGTMITMSDGTRKPIEVLGVGDMIKAFDHTTGGLTDAKIIDYWHYKEPKSGLLTLHFTDDINIRIVTAHSFFCIEDNTYVCIDKNNADEYIGKHFYNAETGGSEELLNVSSSDEAVETFYLATEDHFNCVAEGLLNVEDGLYVAICSSFEYNRNKVINKDKLDEDITEYGLFTYEDFPYMTEEEFNNHKLEYLKIALGKGIISESDLQLLELLYSSDEYNIDIQ